MKMIPLLAAGWVPVVWAQVSAQQDVSGLVTGSAVTILGTLVISFVKGWIVPGYRYDRLETKYDAAIDEIRKMNHDNQEKFLPTVLRLLDFLTKYEGSR